MEKRIIRRGRQKIEMKFIWVKGCTHYYFREKEKNLFKKANEISTPTWAEVVLYSFHKVEIVVLWLHTTHTEKLIDKFLELKLKDCQRDHADVGKSNVFEAFEDLRKESQALDKREKQRILIYKRMHPNSEIPLDKHWLETWSSSWQSSYNWTKILEILFRPSYSSFILNVSQSRKRRRVLELIIIREVRNRINSWIWNCVGEEILPAIESFNMVTYYFCY